MQPIMRRDRTVATRHPAWVNQKLRFVFCSLTPCVLYSPTPDPEVGNRRQTAPPTTAELCSTSGRADRAIVDRAGRLAMQMHYQSVHGLLKHS